ncbi:MAG: BREX system P-loop protein BrxC [Candidatus Caldatribacteriota bacterium]|nr:BREX system P-loop protein BrxC [Candidatus Caldatribacteriota bacterium]
MDKIKDLLLLDFSEDIKDVINLEEQTEIAIQFEIENYIITDKIADYFDKFIQNYKSNIKETGVWVSGFYGSGKSYFGKMLGYLLENKMINGTPFRERFIQRLNGLDNQDILENTIRSLDAYQNKVIFLDIAKQHTGNSFAWTLFRNFLHRLGFLDNVFGYIEYGLFIGGQYSEFLKNVKKITGNEWNILRKDNILVAKNMRKVLVESQFFTSKEYDETKKYYDDKIISFDASRLKEELLSYLEKYPEDHLLFIIDEVSEAINLGKIDLLELEGVSESLSALPQSKGWTIAIAQEDLDQVINNITNVSHKEFNKVSDRFRMKMPLSSEDVETIIKKRLLKKNAEGTKKLEELYKNNNGTIIDFTNLKSKFPTKSDDPDKFITYYPFHSYQIDLLQNFIQAVYSKTHATERGMIIATFTVLKIIGEYKLFNFATASNLVDGAAKQHLYSNLGNKFTKAEKVLKESNSPINGPQLLKVVYFINESSLIKATSENITKLYINDFNGYYELKPKIDDALNDLCDVNLLLNKNNIYVITSDLEKDKIEEMKTLDVEFYIKKREFIERLKQQYFLKTTSHCTFENNPYIFSISSIQGDELNYTPKKYLKINIASIYAVGNEDREKFLENIKVETQENIDAATLVPSVNKFSEIDKYIEEIYRYSVMEDRYQNDDDEKLRHIVKDFSTNKANRLKELDLLIEETYINGTLIYNFEEYNLSENNFENTFKEIEGKIIRNTYTERLPLQLTGDIALKILKTRNPKSLLLCLPGNQEFAFFDSDGNFIGEGLKVVEKLNDAISSVFVSGEELEDKFEGPPYGYTYETILVVLAVLIRAGRLAIKYNGRKIYDYNDADILNLFIKSREFKKASFKAITSTLNALQKQKLVENLKELQATEILGKSFDYNSNDIELVNIIKSLAEYFNSKIEDCKKYIDEFDNYFPQITKKIILLRGFESLITGDNYKDQAEKFIKEYPEFKEAIDDIQKVLKFCETDLNNVKTYRKFVIQIVQELEKLGGVYKDNCIFSLNEQFEEKYSKSVSNNFAELKTIYQKIKDEYYQLIEIEHKKMTQKHEKLKNQVEESRKKVALIPGNLNEKVLDKLDEIIYYAKQHICTNLKISFDTKCESCHYSLNEIISANQNINSKIKELERAKIQIRYPDKITSKEIRIKIEKGKFTAPQYKEMLQEKIKDADSLKDNDVVIIE